MLSRKSEPAASEPTHGFPRRGIAGAQVEARAPEQRAEIGAGSHTARNSPTGEAGAPNLSTLSKPWGRQPICPGCNRGAIYSCICDPFFEDEDSPEPRFDPGNGWGLAERAAYGMGVKL